MRCGAIHPDVPEFERASPAGALLGASCSCLDRFEPVQRQGSRSIGAVGQGPSATGANRSTRDTLAKRRPRGSVGMCSSNRILIARTLMPACVARLRLITFTQAGTSTRGRKCRGFQAEPISPAVRRQLANRDIGEPYDWPRVAWCERRASHRRIRAVSKRSFGRNGTAQAGI
jgi:hypothetical protein